MSISETGPSPSTGDSFWLNRRRLVAYPVIIIFAYLVSAAVWVSLGSGGIDPVEKPYGYDFMTFWAASKLSLEGRPEAAYDAQAMVAIQAEAVEGNTTVSYWHYPPTFQLLSLPLAFLPYFAAYFFWIIPTSLFALNMIWRLGRRSEAVWLFAAAPAFFINSFHGQTAALITGLFAGFILYAPTRPVLAGIFLGLLTFKPHLGVLVPVILLLSGQWVVFGSATVTALVFAGLSVLAFGVDLWAVFFENFTFVRELLEAGMTPWHKMPTVFGAVAIIGVPPSIAFALHGVVAVIVALLTFWVWSHKVDRRLGWALLISASLLISPYMFDYDLLLLLLPVGFLAFYGLERGWMKWEREILVLAWAFPFVLGAITETLFLPTGPAASLLVFGAALRRAVLEIRAGSTRPAVAAG